MKAKLFVAQSIALAASALEGLSARVAAPVIGAGMLALSAASHATIDVTAATTGISDAQVAVLAVLAAMITMGAAVYGVRKVLSLLGR